jgi:hypothetical protein
VHLARRILVVLGQVQAGPSGKCGQFEHGISHAQSWSYLSRCRLVRRENVGNSNVASPMPNPGHTWPGEAGQSGKCGQFERGISHAKSWSYLTRCRLGRWENVGNSNMACNTPNPGRTWSGAGWSVGKCGQFKCGISHSESWSYLARCRLGVREMWAIRTWHVTH